MAALAVALLPARAAAQTVPLPAQTGTPVAPPPAQETVNSDGPGEIFDRARAVWRAQRYPALLHYDIALHYRTGEHTTNLTHEALWRREDSQIFVKSISKEEDQNPHVPRGINIKILVSALNHEFFAPFGVPELSPAYSFRLAEALKRANADSAPNAAGLKEIGNVRIVARDYRVSLIGIERCPDSTDAFHLGLVPLRKPDAYPLRDLWAKTDSYETCRLHVAHNFSESPVGRGPWDITFVQTDFGTLIAQERPLEKLSFRGHEVIDASIAFVNVQPAREDIHTDLWMLGLSNTNGDITREPDDR